MKPSLLSALGMCFCATLLGLPAWAQDSEQVPPGKVYVFDEALGDRGQMEIYFPPGHDPAKPVPGVILFHGGSWVSGHLKDFRYQAQYLASRGLVAATSHYELAKRGVTKDEQGRSRYDITNASGKRAIRWFKAHATALGIDPTRVIAGGGSAGAQTALLASLNPGLNHPDDDASIDTSVVAYLLFNPAAGLAKDGGDAFVMTHAKPAAFPPTIAFFGTSDQFLQGYQGLHDALVAAAAPRVEMWYAPWEGHGFFKGEPWIDLTLIQADRFLADLGYVTGEPTLVAPQVEWPLTQNPNPEVPDALRQREIYKFRRAGHSKGCSMYKADWVSSAEVITLGAAIDEGLTMCPMCQPVLSQCDQHHIAQDRCRACKQAARKADKNK